MSRSKRLSLGDIAATVTRKSIKYIHIYVKPPDGHIEITAPAYATDAEILRLMTAKEAWLREKSALLRKAAPDEGNFMLRGRSYALIILEGSRPSLTIVGDEARLTLAPGFSEEKKLAFIDKWYRNELQGDIERRLPLWEERMGIKLKSFKLRRMKSRWGSCNTKTANVTFNLELIKKPPECLDYIIIHELAHMKEANHSSAFWEIVSAYCPDWKRLRKLTNTL